MKHKKRKPIPTYTEIKDKHRYTPIKITLHTPKQNANYGRVRFRYKTPRSIEGKIVLEVDDRRGTRQQ